MVSNPIVRTVLRSLVRSHLWELDARRGVAVAGQESKDVVGASVTSLGNERQVRGQTTVVTSTSRLLIGVRSGKVVGKLSWALEHLALVVGSVLVLDLCKESGYGGMRLGA